MKVAIIGAGIAGLTMAIALKKANISFVVYESTAQLKPVGAGIAIANNAMQVYRHLGIFDKLTPRGTRISTVMLTDMNLKVLTQSDLTPFEKKYQLANVAIHRSELHKVLVDEVGMEHIILNKRLEELNQGDDGLYTLQFTDGTSASHEYVIGADGIRSKVRQALYGEYTLRDAKQVCWRGVLDFELSDKYNNIALEGWGRGDRFGFVKLLDKQVYWYFLVNEDKYLQNKDLNTLIKDCCPLVKDMIMQTAEEEIFLNKIYDLPLIQEWSLGKSCLIGDAAHATTPNLGQGACQGIEDVYVISKLLEKVSLEEAFQSFTAIRRKKAHGIVCESWKLGQIAQLSNPIITTARNTAFKLLPSFLKDKQIKMMFELQEV
ncbi:MAG: FAD-dependent monooxygenase [Flavobacterium sp.]|uniref:2-polyprenyl-6-methoxyphenol hydroxylase n=1 Tax=Myroides marinus TaxID=703342 RepID=A0A1H6TJ93_9FLAO|nr:FAD-dependent monooxygenase [Myroides marinus]MDM1380057.1 FAD-dependent monooxygenase [Myroides marinus]MDM1387286.1 FAD-dependent monooxygenase [Myroides marinus]MDM1394541.1 FAD-dependent monooxygenase [Myroides marinus]SEI80133.1 2-polyprenyl-6-methoxyphenol hydroxylase [Myroides marinus]